MADIQPKIIKAYDKWGIITQIDIMSLKRLPVTEIVIGSINHKLSSQLIYIF